MGLQMYKSVVNLLAFNIYLTSETRYAPVTDVMSISRYKVLRENIDISNVSKCNQP